MTSLPTRYKQLMITRCYKFKYDFSITCIIICTISISKSNYKKKVNGKDTYGKIFYLFKLMKLLGSKR